MSEYFGKVPDPKVLLDRERVPVSGRGIRKDQAKRHGGTTPAPGRPKWVPIAAAATALAVVAGAIAIASSDESTAPASVATTVSGPDTATIAAPTATTMTSAVTEASAASSVATAAPVTTAPVEPGSLRLTGVAPLSDPVLTWVHDYRHKPDFGDITITLVFNCDSGGCQFSVSDTMRGAVGDEPTAVPVVDGRFSYTLARSFDCPGTGTTGTTTETFDITLSGSQVMNGVSVPTTMQGTWSHSVSEVGDLDAAFCAGYTITGAVNGPLTPA